MRTEMIEIAKRYWMATMAIEETREEMEEIWTANMDDLLDWFQAEMEAGLEIETLLEYANK